MIETMLLAASLIFLLAVWWVVRKRRVASLNQKDESLRRLEEVIKSSQLTNDGFFRSLDLIQKNLESLLARAESAEQRMRHLMLQPGSEKREQYTAAALLLREGQEPHRVASMLNLPLPQVEIVRELQRMAGKDKKLTVRKKLCEEDSGRDNPMPTKVAARREKSSQPILLVDVIKKAANDSSVHGFDSASYAGTDAKW
ncbi:MAG: hypothetical protein HYU31_19075 [Deltaproteobacteria bacterium]|nr:hypothetical protein [Deltaproteobacteria bacterium]MBI2229457.1 hypothetical protein [Deltaproteobacteria bacterium]MBI2366558.1 hypothetical protein [Deltaproteobacteria bacterium]MBI3067025.1 hypothetical protein [Deltaproteobacteria bacterium]